MKIFVRGKLKLQSSYCERSIVEIQSVSDRVSYPQRACYARGKDLWDEINVQSFQYKAFSRAARAGSGCNMFQQV